MANEAYPKPAYPAPAYPAPAYKADYVSNALIKSNFYMLLAKTSSTAMANWRSLFFQPPRPYNYAYAVKDDPSYNDYAHQETSDGKIVTGSYRVLLPDGRTQIVSYKADDYGYVTDVKYEGVAKPYEYKPAYKPAYPAPAPAYPAPAKYP